MDKIAELKQKRTKLMKSLREMLDATITKRKGVDGATADERRRMTDEETTRYESDRRELDMANMELQVEERESELRKEELRLQLKAAGKELSSGPFGSLQEQLIAVRSADSGRGVDPRLLEVRAALGSSTISDSDGGFLIQKDFAAQIYERAYSLGQILPKVKSVPIGANANGIVMNAFDDANLNNGVMGGIIAYWEGEAGTAGGTKPKFRQIDMKLHKLFALCYATDEMMQDAAALESVIMQGVPRAIQLKAEKSFFTGTGAGQCLGFLNSGALIKVPKETGQASATIVYENILNMWNRMQSDYRNNAVWFINQACEPQLFKMSQIIGVGGVPVWLPANGIAGQPFSTLFGRPVVPVQYTSALGTQGDINLVDFGQYLSINKGPIQAVSSIHVQFLTAEQAFRFLWRLNGQPLVDTVFTPLQNDQTYSPFVTLDNR